MYISQINTQINTQINEADPEIAMDNGLFYFFQAKLYKIIIIITHFNSWNTNSSTA